MELNKNQFVRFENGKLEGYLEARWSEKHQAFYTVETVYEDGCEERIKLYSNDVITKEPQRKKSQFTPNKDNCTVKIVPIKTTSKSFGIYAGSNGSICNPKIYTKWISKKICYMEGTDIYAPFWAV